MPALQTTIQDYDLDLLKIIANRWDVDLETRNQREAVTQLCSAMLDSERAAHEWSRLNDRERGALQLLLSAKEHKMPLGQYARLFGDIRQMGEEKRQREKPHLAPVGIAEVLYYRGLIALVFDQGKTGLQPFVIVPGDLAAVLPAHETGYDLEAEDDEFGVEADSGETTLLQRADSAIVDDLTTLLAYLQIEDVVREGNTFSEVSRQAIEDYLLRPADPLRIALMAALAAELGLAANDPEEGFFKPIPAAARKWLDQSRTVQMHSLIQAWENTVLFNELNFVPGLVFESGSWQNDPTLIRKTIKSLLTAVPPDNWFSAAEFVALVKERDPDFQRPAADYDSWYIRDAESGSYLKGFENWHRIDGAVLQGTLTTPMHWLGMVDLGESQTGAMVQLTAYGRAFAGIIDFPDVADGAAKIEVESDGVIHAPRNLSRYDRFQLARFTDWGMPGEPYEYFLTHDSLQRAEQQGIRADHILTFLKRTTQNNVPDVLSDWLDQWSETGGAEVSISRLVVLETDTEDILDTIFDIPELRRFMGTRLGTRAAVVRENQWNELTAELQRRGILVDNNV